MNKKKKTDLEIITPKTGRHRRQEMLEEITKHDTFLPESIMHEDMDKGMMEFVTNQLRIESDGQTVPVNKQLFTIQRWAEFSQTWQNVDSDNNITMPYIVVVRQPDPQPGTHPALQYTIPDRKNFTYTTTPVWDGQQYGASVYTIPQPVPIDIEYEIIIFCDKLRTLNKFNKTVLQKFSSRQAYTKIKGHYIPMILDNIADESVTNIEEKRYYLQVYKIRMEGFLIDESEFKVKPAINRTVVTTDLIKEVNKKTKIIFNDVEVTKFTIKGTGSKSLFSVGEPIGILLSVSVDGILKIRDVDYIHNETTQNIIFNSAPANGSNITILYVSSRMVKVYSDNQELILRNEDFTNSSGTTTFYVSNKPTTILFFTINGTVYYDNFSFDVITKILTITASLTVGDNLVVYYL